MRRLVRVLGIGEIVMLVFVALATLALLAYLNGALQHQPAVVTPVSTQQSRGQPRRRAARGTPR